MPGSTPTARDLFRAEGYFVARDILDVEILDQINSEIAALFALQVGRLGLPVKAGTSRDALRDNAMALLKADVGAYISTARLTQMLPSVHRCLISEPIMRLARELGIEFPVVAAKPSIHIMSNDLKIPNGYHKSPAHQDWRSMQGSLDSIVLWLPTNSVSMSSHPLEIVPGSHLFGLLNTVDHIMTPTVDDPRITEDKYVPIPLQAGDLLAFSSFMVHRTGDRDDGLVRIAMSGRFNNASEGTYVSHGFPDPYKFSYRLDLIHENFPTSNDLRTIFPDVA
jgi:hypothetical protein